MTSPARYLEVCVPAPAEGLSGPLVAEWLERLLANRNLHWVAVSDVDVAGDSRPELAISARSARVMPSITLVALIARATQVVWASLYFCRTEADAKRIRPDEKYEESAEKAVLTVRAVDGSYVYVTGKEQLLVGVESVLPPGTVHVGPIEEMEFPE